MPFSPSPVRTYVRAAKGRSSVGGPAATRRPGLVTGTHRARARRRKVVGERLGAGPRTGAGDGDARSAAGRAADASPTGVEVQEGESLWTVRARAAVGVLQPAWRRRSVVVPIMLRGVLPRTRRPPPAPIEDREACPTASDACARARVPARASVCRLRRARSRRTGVRSHRGEVSTRVRPDFALREQDGDRHRDRALRSRLHQLPSATDGSPCRLASRGARRVAGATASESTRGTQLRPPARHPAQERVHGLRRERPAGSRVRSCGAQARRCDATRMARVQHRDDRHRDSRVRDPVCKLPPPQDSDTRRSFPFPGPKLYLAPVAQLVEHAPFKRSRLRVRVPPGALAPRLRPPPAPPPGRGRGRDRGPGR